MTSTLSLASSQVLPWQAGLAYGLLGLPLAFAALPLYVVPNYAAARKKRARNWSRWKA